MVPSPHANVTLTSLDGDLSVVVYTPQGLSNTDDTEINDAFPAYYFSSRFEHGSMIGSITRKRRYVDTQTGKEHIKTHVLYGTDTWRMPHNSHWPESGVGLASEFGVGDDGNLCYFRCGWPQAMNVTNGVLGYQEAANGEPFLKIGVGELIKGTCPECDSTDIYKFNSPYLFARPPQWKLTYVSQNSNKEISALQLQHQAQLKDSGYHLTKDIGLQDNVLSVTTTLQNLGRDPFSTVWYSHHLFSCDGRAVGPGYALDLNMQGVHMKPIYTEPGTWSWSTPLDQYGKVTPYPNSVHLEMERDLEPGTRIKAEFEDDRATAGGFTLTACHTSIQATLESPQFLQQQASSSSSSSSSRDSSQISMYDFNLYIERGTFSPEPQLLIKDLQPGQSVQWTLKLVIRDDDSSILGEAASSTTAAVSTTTENEQASLLTSWWNDLRGISLNNLPWNQQQQQQQAIGENAHLSAGMLLLAAVACSSLLALFWLPAARRRRRTTRFCRRHADYEDIP